MKNVLVLLLGATCLVAFVGCANIKQPSPQMKDKASLVQTENNIVFRQPELTMKHLGVVQGEAQISTNFFGFNHKEPRPLTVSPLAVTTMTVGNNQLNDPLTSVAIQDAIDSKEDAEGLLVTNIEKYQDKVLWWGDSRVKVTGHAFKLKNLGTLSMERSQLRFLVNNGAIKKGEIKEIAKEKVKDLLGEKVLENAE
ncbi:MAG: hypothetical protein ACOCZ2_03010 [Thermodesulfobacteriota bacterium]